MQSDPHQRLLQQLKDVTARVKKALEMDELDRLPEMAQTHRDILGELGRAGDCQDPELIGMLSEIKAEAEAITKVMEQHQADIRNQMITMGTQKKLAQVYGAQKQPTASRKK